MRHQRFIFLTLVLGIIAVSNAHAQVVSSLRPNTHLRWVIAAKKGELNVDREGGGSSQNPLILIRSLNSELLAKVKEEILLLQKEQDKKYIKDIQFLPISETNSSEAIKISLASESTDVFSFYKDTDSKFIIDFWNETKEVPLTSEVKSKVVQPIIDNITPVAKTNHSDKEINVQTKNENETKNKKDQSAPLKEESRRQDLAFSSDELIDKDQNFRDFRYGAAFVWDQLPLAPSIKLPINLASKTPEFFYPIKDRPTPRNDLEDHLQFAINQLRKKQYGFMFKTLNLLEEKHPKHKHKILIEYMKAVAMLREAIEKGEKAPMKMANNMLSVLAEKANEYDIKRALFKYLIAYYIEIKDHISTLKYAKKLYVFSKENFDYEETTVAAETMMYALAGLNQLTTINEVIEDKTIKKLLPRQVLLGHQSYVQLTLKKEQEVIKDYEINKKSLAPPVHELLLFNTAEAYFRQGKYQESIELFEDFVRDYSFHARSGDARLRIALAYDLLGRDPSEVAELYEHAINNTQDPATSFESKIRYVAITNVRKKIPTEKDQEKRVFLNLKEEEEKRLSKSHLKLLWLTRLRLFIVDGHFQEALTYLSVLPTKTMKPIETRVFEADGAEVVYGVILKEFNEGNYSTAVRIWEIYKDKYIDKVANDPYLNFIVGKSYAKLGLYQGMERHYTAFERIKDSPPKTFPLWISRPKKVTSDQTLVELDIVKSMRLGNWSLAKKAIDDFEKMDPLANKVNFYRGVTNYKLQDYSAAVNDFENYLAKQKEAITFDASEVADLLQGYTDSVYQLGQTEKFTKVSEAILEDTKKYSDKNIYVKKVRERISYLLIEILAGSKNIGDQLVVEAKIKKFLVDYKDGQYKDRLNYLLGVALIANKKTDEGKKLLNELIMNKEVSSHIKELVKAEMALISIKEKTI